MKKETLAMIQSMLIITSMGTAMKIAHLIKKEMNLTLSQALKFGWACVKAPAFNLVNIDIFEAFQGGVNLGLDVTLRRKHE